MAYITYLVLCGFNGFIMTTLDINPTNWQFWATTFCVIGAWFCGREYRH